MGKRGEKEERERGRARACVRGSPMMDWHYGELEVALRWPRSLCRLSALFLSSCLCHLTFLCEFICI